MSVNHKSYIKNNNWKAVVTYFLFATIISLVFRAYTPFWLNVLKLPYGYSLNMLVGFGPLLAAAINRKVFNQPDEYLPLYGKFIYKSLLFMLVPAFVLVVIGIKNKYHQEEHLFAMQVCLLWFIYIFGEESGWRGYLQQILKGNDYMKAIIVGLQWYLWHLSFLFESTNLTSELMFLFVLLIGSFIAVKVTKRTHSLLTAIGLHFSFSVLTNVPNLSGYKYGIVIIVVVWFILLWKWPINNKALLTVSQ